MWGNRLNADTQPAGTQRSADASAARYGSIRGVAAVRAVEIVPALRSSTLQGLAAVRAADGEAAPAPRTSAAAAAEVLNGRMVGIGSSITRETDAAGARSMRQRGALKQTTRGLYTHETELELRQQAASGNMLDDLNTKAAIEWDSPARAAGASRAMWRR